MERSMAETARQTFSLPVVIRIGGIALVVFVAVNLILCRPGVARAYAAKSDAVRRRVT